MGEYWNSGSGREKTYSISLSSQRWSTLLKRCDSDSSFVKNNPTYRSCENHFKNFQEFVDWSIYQYGYNLVDVNGDRWSLDKDIISYGNKIYSPEFCCYLPNRVNKFLTLRQNNRSAYGLGVYKAHNKYFSVISVNSKNISKYGFSTPIDAHMFWLENKKKYGEELAEEFINKNPKVSWGLQSFCERLSYCIKNKSFYEVV